MRATLLFLAKLVFCYMELLKYCRNVANVKTLWYDEVVSKNRYPHLRIRHRRADAEHIRPETNPIQVSFRMEEYIMKKLSKRFLTLAIACVMAMAMAVPAFASGYRPNGYGNYFLNINGTTGTAYQGRVVNLMHTSTVGTDQNFTIGTRSGFTGYYMKVTANPAYAVNRSTNGGRAIIWPLSSGATDSRLYDASSTVIRLNSTRELLTAREPVGDWSQVYFGGSGIAVWIKVN